MFSFVNVESDNKVGEKCKHLSLVSYLSCGDVEVPNFRYVLCVYHR